MASYSPGLRGATWSPRTGSGPSGTPSPGPFQVESLSDMDDDREKMEPPLEDTSHMNFVDGRCTCCPYGYHIDLDFLHYLENLNKGAALKDLKKIHRSKKKLRKSMEVYLHHQETNSTPPPDIIHSTETFMNMVEHENTATNQMLEELDVSVNATLNSIDVMSREGKSGVSEDETDFAVRSRQDRYRAETELALQGHRSDSVSSLESHSTYSSEISPLTTSSTTQQVTTTTTVTSLNKKGSSTMTSLQLANNMANLLPDDSRVASTRDDVSPETLQAIREQMAISLQRMKELEEQVKAVPVLQVRINVLKEEKRLLGLQLKARSNKLNTCTVGVGDCRIDDDVEPLLPMHSRFQTVTNINLSQLGLKSVANGELRPPRPAMRSIGVGDGNVFENQLQLAAITTTGGTKYHEKEFHTEQSTEVREKEVKTVFLGQSSDSDAQLRLFPPWKSADRQKKAEKPERPPRRTRSIGIGEDDVFDSGSNVHVHEKELRTVYIGEEQDKGKETRNVGILCKAAMRDVGVTYKYDNEKPTMRNIAVGVGEIGVGEGFFAEGDGSLLSNTSHTTHMALQQMNLAAFHSRHIHINNEQLLTILDTMLKKELRSASTQCSFPSVDKAIQHTVNLTETLTVGCGTDSVDVVVRERVQMKSVGVENRPLCMNRLVNTDRGFSCDIATNTFSQMITKSKATSTDPKVVYPAAVNTDTPIVYNVSTDTEVGLFEAIDAIKTTASNTDMKRLSNCATNTERTINLSHHNFDFDITFASKGVNTDVNSARKNVFDRGCNTDTTRMFTRGINTQGPKLVERGITVSRGYMPSAAVQTEMNVTTRGVGDSLVRMPTHNIGSGDMSVSECENCHKRNERMRPVAVNTDPVLTKSVASGYQSIREGHVTEVTSKSKLSSRMEPIQIEYSSGGGERSTSGSSTTREITRTVKSSQPVEITRTVKSSEPVEITRTVKSSQPVEITKTVMSTVSAAQPVETGRQVMVERTVTRTGKVQHNPLLSVSGELANLESQLDGGASLTAETEGGSSVSSEIGGGSSVTGKMGGGSFTTREIVISSTRSGGSDGLARNIEFGSEHSSGGSGGGHTVIERSLGSSGGGHTVIDRGLGSSGGGHTVIERSLGSSGGGHTMIEQSLGSSGRGHTVIERSLGSSGGGHTVIERSLGSSGGGHTMIERSLGSSGGGHTVIEQSLGSSGGGHEVEEVVEETQGGGSKMKVVRHTETSYVGGHPVNKTSNIVLQDEPQLLSELDMTHAFRITSETTRDPGLIYDSMLNNNNQGETTEFAKSVQPKGKGRRVVITETRIERKMTGKPGESTMTTSTTESVDSNGSLRSIMKQPGTDGKMKKEISFSEDVLGGYVSSSSDGEGVQEDEAVDEGAVPADEEAGSDSDGSQSSVSYDEGSYDGRAGKIVYTCKDDESIAQGAPGATMYDENIRETYELGTEMSSSCETYAQWLEDSTGITTKQLNAALAVIQHEWFKVSSTKTSDPSQVEELLAALNHYSSELMQHIVNLADANGNTALHYAVSHCNMEIVSLLMDTQVTDVNKQNRAGYTAIMLASLAQVSTDRQRDIISRMFNTGDVNARASQAGQTALMLAVSHGRQIMVHMLLEAGASVNMQDEDGSTALMCASEHGHTDIVRNLLGQPDCDSTLTDNDGSSALSIAMEAGHRDIGVLLYAHANFKQGSPILGRGKGKRRTPTGSSSSLSSSSSLNKR